MISTFSINSMDGDHLGFIALLGDTPEFRKGSLMLKLQVAEPKTMDLAAFKTLKRLPENVPLPFTTDSSNILTFVDEDGVKLGKIEGQWMTVGTEHFELQDNMGNF